MSIVIPRAGAGFLQEGERFRALLQETKQLHVVPDYAWYPYDTLSALPLLAKLMEPVFEEEVAGVSHGAVADIGCADGDLGMLFASLGAQVDALDHLETSFNQMRGVAVLRDTLKLPVNVYDIDLDGRFDLPRPDYSLAFFMGTLYHLKNPFYAMEKLAQHADWCVVSTRIAQLTPRRVRMEEEPLAYLLGAREANNDPTNFWIFSASGLLRLCERTGWTVISHERVGRQTDSDPVDPAADERMFVLLKSQTRHPEMAVRALEGWHPVENDSWRWTAKQFSLEVVPPAGGSLSEFALRFHVPEALAASGSVQLTCSIGGQPAGSITCVQPERLEFRGRFPQHPERQPMRLDFQVDSGYTPSGGDVRDLGVIVPLVDASRGNRDRIPFRIS